MVTIKISPWLRDLYHHLENPTLRYFVIYGGRGSGKSEGIAQLMIYLAVKEPGIKILCARHIQHTIAESSKARIEKWIERMGIQTRFHITQNELIYKENGSKFIFKGLSNITKDNITSIDDVKYLWIEEAHNITKEVWERTNPSIRAPGSRIFITFNPHFSTDILYDTFVSTPHRQAFTRQINYTENPWFETTPLHEVRLADLDYMPAALYQHIWEGALREFNDMPVIFPNRFLNYVTIPPMDSLVISLDTAYTTKESADYTAIGCFGKFKINYYLLDVRRGKFEFDTLYTTLLDFHAQCSQQFGYISQVIIEYKASGISLAQTLRTRTQLPIHEYRVGTKDKFTRVCEILDILHSSFYIPKDAPWKQAYTAELAKFSANDEHEHDDQVDMTSQALTYLRNNPVGNSIFNALY